MVFAVSLLDTDFSCRYCTIISIVEVFDMSPKPVWNQGKPPSDCPSYALSTAALSSSSARINAPVLNRPSLRLRRP